MRAFSFAARAFPAAAFVAALAVCPPLPAGDGDRAGWWDAARKGIAEAEYEVGWSAAVDAGGESGWQAPNRVHGFRARFTDSGVVLEAREGAAWQAHLDWIGWGAQAAGAIDPRSVVTQGNRIARDRPPHREWFVNDRTGLVQHVVLDAPPLSGAAELHLALHGSLVPRRIADGRAIDLADAHGARVLRIAVVAVTDAAGRALAATLRAGANSTLVLVLDAAGATWPVEMQAAITTATWSATSGQAAAAFGAAVAAAGDVNGDGYDDLAVGAPGFDAGAPDEGRAFVFFGSASGPSTTPGWSTDGGQSGAGHGFSVAAAGDVNGDGYGDLAVGAPLHDGAAGVDAGRASLYLGSALGPDTVAHWNAHGAEAGGELGHSVASAGDVNGDGFADLVVGAPLQDGSSGLDTGLAYLYRGSATGLGAAPAWAAEGDRPGSAFGRAVATAGDVNGDGFAEVVVGAPDRDTTLVGAGRASVFPGSASGLGPVAAWLADGDEAQAAFGHAVATAGDVDGDGFADLIVGAPGLDGATADEGRAQIFAGSATGLATTPMWTVVGGAASVRLGSSVSTAGDVNGDGFADVVVGAAATADSPTSGGSVAVYHGSGAGPDTTADAELAASQPGALLGAAVALAGDLDGDGYSDVVVGAPSFDGDASGEGQAQVLFGGAAGLATGAGWTDQSDQAHAEYGTTVASAGDVNGDGYSEVLVGARLFDSGQSNEGRAFAYLGSAGGLLDAALAADGNQAGAEFGTSVSSAGDVDGDGYDDVVVGAPLYDNGQSNEGAAFVYHGSPGGLAPAPNWVFEGNQVSARLGSAVAAAGDVNGDGYGDVLVGADSYDGGSLDEGRVLLFLGSATGLAHTAAWHAELDVAGAFLGACAGAGDVNGDGYSDVVVGASAYSGGLANEGLALVYHGSPFGLAASYAWRFEGDQAAARFGFALAGAGDVDGDGYSDVVIGAPLHDGSFDNEGRALLFQGSPTGLAQSAAWAALGAQADARLGLAVATAGDVNGDGFSDVVVGAPGYDGPESNEGRAYLHLGSSLGLSHEPAWTAESDQAEAGFGRSVGTAGDVNGDGYADVIVGARSFDDEQVDEGKVFVYYGNDGLGVPLAPQQRRADDAGPIARLGASDATDGFRLALGARSPFGRARVKLEHEVAPLGVLLDGSATATSPDWVDTGAADGAWSEGVTGLAEGTPYHWRMRTRYDPAAVPFQGRGRWIGTPVAGQQETDLRTSVGIVPAGEVPDGSVPGATPLRVDKVGDGTIALEWGASCTFTDDDYAVYQGSMGNFGSYTRVVCSTSGATALLLPAEGPSAFWLVVPHNGEREGSYGTGSDGTERVPGAPACLPQLAVACP